MNDTTSKIRLSKIALSISSILLPLAFNEKFYVVADWFR